MGSVKNSSDLRQRAAEVCSGCVRARDRVQAAIGRIRRLDPDYHAFVTVCEARALQMAEKLDEELKEYQESKSLEELADLLEVIHSVALARGSSIEEIEQIRIQKAEKRGSFGKRILLETVIEKERITLE